MMVAERTLYVTSKLIRRILVTALGVTWLWLGFVSDRVPWFDETVWIVGCGLVAGSAFALARHTSMFALKRYTVLVAAVGVVRSLAYGTNGSIGPLVVWLLLTLTTITATLGLAAQSRWEDDRGSG